MLMTEIFGMLEGKWCLLFGTHLAGYGMVYHINNFGTDYLNLNFWELRIRDPWTGKHTGGWCSPDLLSRSIAH